MFRKTSIAIVTALTVVAAGCTAEDRATGTGALAGGAIGAGIGQLAGGNTESTLVGAAIGAGVGAVAGNVIGRSNQREGYCRYRDRYGNVYVDECPAGY